MYRRDKQIQTLGTDLVHKPLQLQLRKLRIRDCGKLRHTLEIFCRLHTNFFNVI